MDNTFFDDISIPYLNMEFEKDSGEDEYIDSDSESERKKKEYNTLVASQIQTLTTKEGVYITREFDRNFNEIKKKKKISMAPSIIAMFKFKKNNIYFTKKTLSIVFPLLSGQSFKKLDLSTENFSFLE